MTLCSPHWQVLKDRAETLNTQYVLSILSTSQSWPISSLDCVYIKLVFASYPLHHVYISDTVVDAAMLAYIKSNHVCIAPLITWSHRYRRHCRYCTNCRHRFFIVSTSCFSNTLFTLLTLSTHRNVDRHRVDIISSSYINSTSCLYRTPPFLFTSSTSKCWSTSCPSVSFNLHHRHRNVSQHRVDIAIRILRILYM